jgi:hypothetical protein
MMTRRKKILMFAPLAIVGAIAFIAVGGAIVRVLWNALLPGIFGLPAISFWQALGLLALSRILVGGFGMRGCGPRGYMRRMQEMTPEERERFRQALRARWGAGDGQTGGPSTAGV